MFAPFSGPNGSSTRGYLINLMLAKPAGGLTNWELLYLKGSEIYANFHTRKKMLNFKFNLSFQKQRKMGFILTLKQQKTVGDSKDPI